MSFLLVTVPVSLLLAGSLLGLVIFAVRSGAFDDWEGPAQRLLYDDDETPEIDAAYRELPVPEERAPESEPTRARETCLSRVPRSRERD